MSLITDQQRNKSQVQQPSNAPITSFPTAGTTEPAIAPLEPALEQINTNAEAPDASKTLADSFSSLDTTNEFSSPQTTTPTIDQTLTGINNFRSPSIWQNVGNDFGFDRIYSPEILKTTAPTLYSPEQVNAQTATQLRDDYLGLSTALRNQRNAQTQAAQQLQQRTNNPRALPNVPRVDKPWYAPATEAVGGLFSDILFGTKEAQENAEGKRQSFNPLAGEYGSQGAGLGGLTKYILGLPLNLGVGFIGETAKLERNIGRAVVGKGYQGVTGGTVANRIAEVFGKRAITDRKDPNALIGFDWKRAERSNLILDALTGKQVGDTNDALGTNKGVFFSPRRTNKPGQNIIDVAASDPLGTAIEVATQLFNPFDKPLDTLIGAGIARVFRSGKKTPTVMPNVSKPTTPPKQSGSQILENVQFANNAGKKTPVQKRLPPGRVQGQSTDEQLAEVFGERLVEIQKKAEQPQPRLNPAAPPPERKLLPPASTSSGSVNLREQKINVGNATSSVKAPRIIKGETSATQHSLPAPLKLTPDEVKAAQGTPSETAVNVGLGKPSDEFIEPQGEIVIKGEREAVEQSTEVPNVTVEFTAPDTPPLKTPESAKVSTGNKLEFVPHPLANGKRTELDVQEVERLAQDIVGKDGANGIGNRYNQAKEFIENNSSIQMSELKRRADGSYVFVDGRHRWAVLRDKGYSRIPVMLDDSEFLSAQKLKVAEELAAHKVITQEVAAKLDDVIESTVDFGRRELEDLIPYQKLDVRTTNELIEANARLNLPEKAYKLIDQQLPAITRALREGDYDQLVEIVGKYNIDPQRMIKVIADANNAALESFPVVSKEVAKVAQPLLTKTPTKVYHGTTVADWMPNYNLELYGSRGELGSGLYTTTKTGLSVQYAKAVTSENVNSVAASLPLSDPTVYKLQLNSSKALDARVKFKSSGKLVNEILSGLPPELIKEVKRSLNRDPETTYVGLWNKLESSMVRAGLEPTEELLQSVSSQVSSNLRRLGFDSVVDNESEFVMLLDNIAKNQAIAKQLPTTTATEAATARYNADAYTAKYYNERLSSDANLRDSTAKLHNQNLDTIDNQLSKVQQEIIAAESKSQSSTVLPPATEVKKSRKTPKPKSVDEALAKTPPTSKNPCEP